jgi:hypothetical protein
MTIVKNLGLYCVLACLESFLADNGRRKSWQEIRDILHAHNLCDYAGAVPTIDAFRAACGRHLNIYTKEVPFHFPVRDEFWDGSLFIFSTEGGLHCFRFYDQIEPTKVLLMDPDHKKGESIREFAIMDQEAFEGMHPRFYRLKLYLDM